MRPLQFRRSPEPVHHRRTRWHSPTSAAVSSPRSSVCWHSTVDIALYPFFLAVLLILMIVMTGFLYRYEVVALLDYQTSLSHQVKKNRILGFTLPRITALFFYLAFGLLILLGNASYAMLYLLIGVAGSYLFIIKTIKSSCHALLERGKRRKGYKHRLHLVSNSHIDNFLRNSIYFIQLLTFLDLGCLVLYDFFGTSSLNQVVLYTIIITGIFCTVLAVCFNLNKVLSYHIDECRQLKHLGYTHEALLKTLHQEIGKTLIILNLLALYYPLLLAVKNVCGLSVLLAARYLS